MRIYSFLWIFPFFSFIFGYYIAHSFFHTKQMLAPNLVGKTVQYAVKNTSRLGLNVRMLREQVDSDLPNGIVLEQVPRQSSMIKPNQHIFITLSKRPDGILAPKLLEESQKTVFQKCKKLGVRPKTFWIESSYPKNFCVAQCPSKGQVLEKRSIVTYFSSGKNRWVIFPKLKGKPLLETKKFLEDEDVKVEVFYKNKAGKKSNRESLRILDQKPMAGSIVDKSKTLYVQLQVG